MPSALRSAAVVALVVLAGTTGAHADDAAALLQISTDIQNAAAQAHVDAERATFLLQVVAISVGFSLGFSIWACWLKGRQARNP